MRIAFTLVNDINLLVMGKKSPWLTVLDDVVTAVYPNRDVARSAKTGKPVKYEAGMGFDMIDKPTDTMPKGEEVADAMGHTEPVKTIDDSALPTLDASDASEFAQDKAAQVEVAPLSTQPIPPVAPSPVLAADKAAKIRAEVRHASEVVRPTKLVWSVADRMNDEAKAAGRPVPTRKEVMAECERIGIAFYTARTQYQVWKSMQPN